MPIAEIQLEFFQIIKSKLASPASMVDEIARILEVSTDSAYRRIRGEKPLTIDEIYLLCANYKISIDQLFKSESLIFSGTFIRPGAFRFDHYLESAIQHLKYMASFKKRKMYYLCKDIPLFHHFYYREVAAFKHYVWLKGIFNDPGLANKKFSLKNYPDHVFELGKQALDIYNQIDSVEIWNIESLNSSMRQIDYYYNSGMFEDPREAILIYEAYEKLIAHLDKIADLGYKFKSDEKKSDSSGTLEMYLNEMIIGDNSILVQLDNSRLGFIIHTVINIMTTRDVHFCDNMYESIQNIMRKSTLISSVSERERARFFKYLRQRIENRKLHIKA